MFDRDQPLHIWPVATGSTLILICCAAMLISMEITKWSGVLDAGSGLWNFTQSPCKGENATAFYRDSGETRCHSGHHSSDTGWGEDARSLLPCSEIYVHSMHQPPPCAIMPLANPLFWVGKQHLSLHKNNDIQQYFSISQTGKEHLCTNDVLKKKLKISTSCSKHIYSYQKH